MERYKEPIELPENIHELIDLSAEQLEHMVEKEDLTEGRTGHYIFNAIPNLRLPDKEGEEIFNPEDEEVDPDEENWDEDPLLEEVEEREIGPMTRARRARKDLDHG